jgi:hypothetical protein
VGALVTGIGPADAGLAVSDELEGVCPVLANALNTNDWQVVESAVAIVRFGPKRQSSENFEQGRRVVVSASRILRRVAGDDEDGN